MAKYSDISVDELFEQALEQPANEREAFLLGACPEQEELRNQVLALLEAHDNVGSFLEGSAESARDALYSDISRDWQDKSESRVGTQVEKYTLLAEIGRGGCSTVYNGHREEEDWKQDAAIKILRRGLDTDDILRRFHAERQILTHLTHPGVASIYDAGITDDGLPWFAMELVDGENITDFCESNVPGLEERLKLFLQVTEIISFAHRHLIVHRDIKPSNILVSAEGHVKLLDFGISKVLEVTDEEMLQVYTRTGVNPSTPDYAAPEQLSGKAITTETDVYQLGLLLSKLLTGSLPVATGAESKSDDRSNPKKPSDLASDIKSIPTTVLCGDLDTIILKALRHEPEQRYPTADALAEDIHRYLENRPIEARPPSLRYRMAKFFRRHTWAVPVGALATLGVIAYLVTVTIYAERLQTERDLKTAEAERAENIKSFLVDFLRAPDPYEGEGHDVTMQQALDNAADKAEIELADKPVLQAEVFGTLATVYRNLDLHEEAVSMWDKQLPVLQATARNNIEELELRREKANSMFRSAGRDEAIQELQAVETQLEKQYPDRVDELARTHIYLGQIEQESGDLNQAAAYFEQAIAFARSVAPQDDELLAMTLLPAGRVHSNKGQFSDAFDLFDEAEKLLKKVHGADDLRVIQTGLAKADTMARMRKQPEETLAIYESAASRFEKTLGPLHKETISALSNSAYVYNWMDQHTKAESIYRTTLSRRLEKYANQPAMPVALNMVSLGTTLSHLDRNQEAADMLVDARKMMAKLVEPGHYQLGYSDMTLVHIYEVLENYPEMERVAKRALDLFSPVMDRGRSVREAAQCRYAGALAHQGRRDEAQPLLRDAIEALQKVSGPENILDECNTYLSL